VVTCRLHADYLTQEGEHSPDSHVTPGGFGGFGGFASRSRSSGGSVHGGSAHSGGGSGGRVQDQATPAEVAAAAAAQMQLDAAIALPAWRQRLRRRGHMFCRLFWEWMQVTWRLHGGYMAVTRLFWEWTQVTFRLHYGYMAVTWLFWEWMQAAAATS
jgi:hypothetical protein